MAKKQLSLLDRLHHAHSEFSKTVSDLVGAARKKAADEVAAIEEVANRLIGKAGAQLRSAGLGKAAPAERATRGPKKRIRRDPKALKAIAEKAADIIKNSGKDGISASDLKKQVKGIDGAVKVFIEKHSDHKVKQEGTRRSTVYRMA